MLNLYEQPHLRGEEFSRRSFLQMGSLALLGSGGAFSLPSLLRAESAAGVGRSPKSVIMIYLVGGPPHQDMFDLKPNAPSEIAGPWRPIATNVPGMEICEAFPRLAQLGDKLTVIRSLVGNQSGHDAIQVFNGHHPRNPTPSGGWPQFGSMVSKVQGPSDPSAPPFVSLCYPCTHGPYNEPGSGFLGTPHTPFRPLGPTRADMTLNGVTADHLADRVSLLKNFDQLRRDIDVGTTMEGLDAFTEQAMGLLTSSRLADALDLSKEDPATIERYGTGNPKISIDGNGAPRVPQSLLMARRLIEAGVRVVTLNYSKWDWHGGPNNSIFKREQEDFPIFDQCVSALVEDLHTRGLADDCAVVIWGEFGRTPKISARVGRDHWPQVNSALLAGGGFKHGQVIGATDRIGGEAIARPVTFGEVYASLYQHLGINGATTITDLNGRPQYLVEDQSSPLPELI
ncbi:DUF1501 domain-containing protein [Planctomicrobium sp.]|nr:DUF1501 domain-containing protein [Planctomicrobium sp.]MDA7527868.1 DUF1501 domain-containing protein [bacterium]MDB4733171.1 DUF1501 domain-containing protein [Planctomicrobium sp.]MDB4743620.1 DUF1501 domain-containing protein [Planctomicrobium sp.]